MIYQKKRAPLPSIDCEKLHKLYVTERRAVGEIANAFGTSIHYIRKSIRMLNISRPARSSFEIEEARELCFDKSWSLQRIANKFGVTRQAVHHRLQKAGFDLKARQIRASQIDRELLIQMYVTGGFSLRRVPNY